MCGQAGAPLSHRTDLFHDKSHRAAWAALFVFIDSEYVYSMRSSTLAILIAMTAGFSILCYLGFWQLDRLEWKEALIKRVESRLAFEPVALRSLELDAISQEEDEYRPVVVSGEFDHAREVYFQTTSRRGGASGWDVLTPLILDDGRWVIVNRGFVPFALIDPSTRTDGLVMGQQTIEGLLRTPLQERPSAGLDNRPEERKFFWKDFPVIVKTMGLEREKTLPLIVDAAQASTSYRWPFGGSTIVQFSNNHLQYVITWFGLAASLLGVGFAFLWSRRKTVIAMDEA